LKAWQDWSLAREYDVDGELSNFVMKALKIQLKTFETTRICIEYMLVVLNNIERLSV
jgi:hypothetical protein